MPSAAPAAVDEAAERIARRFEALPQLLAEDADLIRRARHLTCDFKLGVGTLALVVSVVGGRVTTVARGPFLLRPWAFSLSAAPETWGRLLEPIPAPGFHDLLALSKRGLLAIEGNLHPLMANLQVIKDIVSAPRGRGAGGVR